MSQEFSIGSKGTKWPSGDYVPIAQWAIGADELSSLLGVDLDAGHEPGMGQWVGVGIVLSGEELVEFVLYEGDVKGFAVRADREANHAEVLDKMLSALQIDKSSLVWVSELLNT